VDEPQPDPRIQPVSPATAAEIEMWTEHADVLAEAQQIHINRTPERGDLWLQDGRNKMMDCAYDKVLRLINQTNQTLIFNEDDALDAINYLVFAIRCNRYGRIERRLP
jgi:hypothetical protein